MDNLPATRTYVNGVTVSNDRFVEYDYNEASVFGFRAALRSSLGGDREVTRFLPEESDLTCSQVALTLKGDVGIGDLIYAGAYYRRNSETVSDYSSYVAYVPWAAWTQQFACNEFYWPAVSTATIRACTSTWNGMSIAGPTRRD